MAKTKTLEEQIAEHEAAIKKLREDATAAALKLVAEKKTALQEALVDYNNAVKLSGGKAAAMRLVSDTPSGTTTKSATKRLRLSDETRTDITEKIVKAAKAHGENGATKADIVKYLDTSGYKIGVNYNQLHLFALLNTLRDGNEPSVTTVGAKAKMRYVAA